VLLCLLWFYDNQLKSALERFSIDCRFASVFVLLYGNYALWLVKKLALLSPPEIKPKPIRTTREARVLPRSGLLRVMTSSSDWSNLLFVLDVIGHRNFHSRECRHSLFVWHEVTSISVIWYQVCYLSVQKWNALLRIRFNRAINIEYFMESECVRHLRTSWSSIGNRTSERKRTSDRDFWYKLTSAWILYAYTFHGVLCLLYTYWDLNSCLMKNLLHRFKSIAHKRCKLH